MPLLFSYGTLQLPNVQVSTFGRLLHGDADELVGYEQSLVQIDDPGVVRASGKTHHPIVRYTGRPDGRVRGMVFEISEAELLSADEYEVADYARVAARLASGRQAWVYVDARAGTAGIDIRVDDLTGPEIAALLEEHIRDMKAISPPESKHALDLDGLRKPEITFWTAWHGGQLAGCGAIKALDAAHGEIKSMRTSASHRGRGVATAILRHILREASARGYERVSLETGSMPFFEPARRLYRAHGFEDCEPFNGYKPDPNSAFLTRRLRRAPGEPRA